MFVKSPNSQSKSLLTVKRTKHNKKKIKKLKLKEENKLIRRHRRGVAGQTNCLSFSTYLPNGGWVGRVRCLQNHQLFENNKAHKGSTLPTNTQPFS